MTVSEHIATHIGAKILHAIYKKADRIWYATLLANSRIRVSTSALLRVRGDDGRFLLIRNGRRPELHAPIGGVHKAIGPGSSLARLGFASEGSPVDTRGGSTQSDLRGFVRGRDLGKFVDWFEGGFDRESDTDCIRREFAEEIRENGPSGLRIQLCKGLTLLWRVVERPKRPQGSEIRQFRIAAVYAPTAQKEEALLAKRLVKSQQSGLEIISASIDEIIARRSKDGRRIAPQTQYLFSSLPAESDPLYSVE